MPSGGGGSQNTTTQVQQIPEFEQQYAQQNQDIAASLASQPFPTYQGQLIAGFAPQQQQGMDMAGQASTAYQPDLNAAEGLTAASTQQWNPQTAQQWMNPYAMAAMAPQLQQLQLQQQQQGHQIDANSTQAGAFGDDRQAVAQGLNNFYGNLAQNDLVSQGMNQAYNTGMAGFQQNQQNLQAAGNQFANLGQQQQQLGIQGAGALFNAGTQQQQLNQQQLTESYNNFMNQVNWPAEQLNMRIAALANSPYSHVNYTSLAPSSASAQNVGAAAGLTGLIGNLTSGGKSGSGGGSVFGGS